jgi:hypothetical protein
MNLDYVKTDDPNRCRYYAEDLKDTVIPFYKLI